MKTNSKNVKQEENEPKSDEYDYEEEEEEILSEDLIKQEDEEIGQLTLRSPILQRTKKFIFSIIFLIVAVFLFVQQDYDHHLY